MITTITHFWQIDNSTVMVNWGSDKRAIAIIRTNMVGWQTKKITLNLLSVFEMLLHIYIFLASKVS
jgi:hypothetical protein